MLGFFCFHEYIHSMMLHCPFCGHHLPHPLLDGISSCANCYRAFDSSKQNLLLSTSWLVRKRGITEPQYLIYQFEISPEDAEMVITYVSEEGYTHEEFARFLKERFKIINQRKAS